MPRHRIIGLCQGTELQAWSKAPNYRPVPRHRIIGLWLTHYFGFLNHGTTGFHCVSLHADHTLLLLLHDIIYRTHRYIPLHTVTRRYMPLLSLHTVTYRYTPLHAVTSRYISGDTYLGGKSQSICRSCGTHGQGSIPLSGTRSGFNTIVRHTVTHDCTTVRIDYVPFYTVVYLCTLRRAITT